MLGRGSLTVASINYGNYGAPPAYPSPPSYGADIAPPPYDFSSAPPKGPLSGVDALAGAAGDVAKYVKNPAATKGFITDEVTRAEDEIKRAYDNEADALPGQGTVDQNRAELESDGLLNASQVYVGEPGGGVGVGNRGIFVG